MAKQILIDSYFGMVRTAIAEAGQLVDYYEESPEQGRNKGNIYRGVVKRVDAPIQAAFVKFAGGRDGFLPLRDAAAGKPPKPGDSVLVQVVKDEVGDKGAALTAKLSLSGRYLVFIPERDGEGGISSKISDEERAALKRVMGELQVPDGASVILRTAASDKSVPELQADLDRLIETHREINDKFAQGKDPALLFREAPPALRYLREYYTDDVERIWVNQEEVLDQCRQFFYLYEPKSAAKVVLSQDGPLLFHRLGLEAEVEKLSARKVALPSGANIVIDQAEALVAIDVNSAKAGGRIEEPKGKAKGKGRGARGGDLEETVFAVNREAAAEIARQLRLRDLGGIIIVDFIDMEQEKHRRQIEDAMRKALSRDKAKVKIYEISPLGIMQISRQRLRKAGHQFSRLSCDTCQGRGWHPSPSAGALAALRKLEERLHGKKAGQSLTVSVPYPVANKLMNDFREHVLAMEKRYGCAVKLNALPAASGEPVVAALGGSEGGPIRENRSPEKPGQARHEGRPPKPEDGRGRDGRKDGAEGRAQGRKDGAEGRNPGRRDGAENRAEGHADGPGSNRGGADSAAEGQGRERRGRRGRRDGRRDREDARRDDGRREDERREDVRMPDAGPMAAEDSGPQAHEREGYPEDAFAAAGMDPGLEPWREPDDSHAEPTGTDFEPAWEEAAAPTPEPAHAFEPEPVAIAAEPGAIAAGMSGPMAAAVAEIVNAEVTLSAESPDGTAAGRGRRGRRGGRGRGRNAGGAPDGSPAKRQGSAPKGEARKAPAGGRSQGQARGQGQAGEVKAKAAKEGGRPRRRGGRGRGGAGDGSGRKGKAGD